ncbi:hypothetical protein D3OALGA1CA_3520 [Olavius algarvensis associated proteobacterium Delta 3]|nr:hypothetical protein D3OALGA1CA_3520 [Olavius algarvensis associated proteobacterium Delta 3]
MTENNGYGQTAVKQVDADFFFRLGSEKKGQFCSYWHQVDEIRRTRPDSLLEIGIGSGFFRDYTQKHGVSIFTLDIDIDLNPAISATVLQLPFRNDTFDLVVCFEMLEHLPFKYFPVALDEIRRVSKEKVVISLPHSINRVYRILLDLPKIGFKKGLFELKKTRFASLPHDDTHHWEIDIQGYPLSRITSSISNSGFNIDRSYRVFEKPYHHFFVLSKNST